jgi:hypothetical protein
MIARLAALLCFMALAGPAAATAQESPFGPIPQPAPEPVTQAPVDPDDDGGLSAVQQLLIGGAAFLLLGGIAFAIVRDARASAPAESHGPVDAEGDRIKGTRPPPKQRVQKGRQKAKAARRARRRNR